MWKYILKSTDKVLSLRKVYCEINIVDDDLETSQSYVEVKGNYL